MINHFGIDNDMYAKQFTQGNIEERMDPQYMEFFRLQQQKAKQLVNPITANDEEEMLNMLKKNHEEDKLKPVPQPRKTLA
jgi:hypothetical protein